MSKKTSAQIWIEYLPLRAALAFAGLLPRALAMRLGVFLGGMIYRLPGKLRRVGMRNLEIAFPEKTLAERSMILRRAFQNMGRVAATFSGFGTLNYDNISELIEYDPEPEFDAAYKQTMVEGRGRIILTGHMGNWELYALAYPKFFGPVSFLARRMDNPKIEEMVARIRTRLGNRQIDKSNSASAILRLMRSNGTIGILADVNAHPKEGVFVPFFGVPACTATGIAMIALRSNAVIIPTVAVWDEAKGKYSIVYDEIIDPQDTGDRRADIERITAECVAATERMIRAHPDQWIWVHRRWKTRPPGEPAIY